MDRGADPHARVMIGRLLAVVKEDGVVVAIKKCAKVGDKGMRVGSVRSFEDAPQDDASC